MLQLGAKLASISPSSLVRCSVRSSNVPSSRRGMTGEAAQRRKLIVGLGNPGSQYQATRHNIGFTSIDLIAEKHGIPLAKSKFNSVYGTGTIGNQSVIIVKPQTFMNLSGTSVKPWLDYYKIKEKDCVIVHDAADLPPGCLKLKIGGNSGGQNGIQNIINLVGSKQFPRLMLGIGRPERSDVDLRSWVLGRFTSTESPSIDNMLSKATDCLSTWAEHGLDKAMCDFNGELSAKVKKPNSRPADPNRTSKTSESSSTSSDASPL